MNGPVVVVLILTLSCGIAFAEDQNSAAVAQAKQDYRLFLQQLKELQGQYSQVTGEMKKVIKEEGVPVFNEETGEMEIVHEFPETTTPSGAFAKADLKETDKEMIVRIDLPGVRKKDIKVSIRDGRYLDIEGEREPEEDSGFARTTAKNVRLERPRGRFKREIELPSYVEDKRPKAKYQDGVLTVRLKKSEAVRNAVSVSVD